MGCRISRARAARATAGPPNDRSNHPSPLSGAAPGRRRRKPTPQDRSAADTSRFSTNKSLGRLSVNLGSARISTSRHKVEPAEKRSVFVCVSPPSASLSHVSELGRQRGRPPRIGAPTFSPPVEEPPDPWADLLYKAAFCARARSPARSLQRGPCGGLARYVPRKPRNLTDTGASGPCPSARTRAGTRCGRALW